MSKRKPPRSPKQRAASARNLRKAQRARAAAAPKRKRHKRARAAAAAPKKRRRARAAAAAPKKRRRRARAAAAAPRRRAKRTVHRGRRSRRRARDLNGMGNFFGSPEFKRALKKQSGGSVKKKKKSGRGRKHARKAAPRKRRFVKARGRHAGTTRKGRARRRVIRSKSRRHRVKGYTIKRGRRAGKRVKMHYSYEAAAFENPLSTGEVVVVGIIGVLGALVAQGADRFAATHALSGTIAADGGGLEDSPPQGKDYNANSVNAPMGLVRGAIAAGLALVPLVGAHFVRSPMARTSMQAFGFGALIRTGLKVGSDVTGWAMRKSAMGQRLFQPEIVAHALDKKFAADLKANKDLAALQGMPILGGVVSQSVSAGMLAQNANSRTPCQQMQQQFAPPPPPPPAGMGAPLYTPPAAAPAAEPPSASKPNGIVHHVSGGNLYNPSLRD